MAWYYLFISSSTFWSFSVQISMCVSSSSSLSFFPSANKTAFFFLTVSGINSLLCVPEYPVGKHKFSTQALTSNCLNEYFVGVVCLVNCQDRRTTVLLLVLAPRHTVYLRSPPHSPCPEVSGVLSVTVITVVGPSPLIHIPCCWSLSLSL